ncbi:MAG: universal stress protein [Alphaproteobacteria bacterium]|nr:universal stress protein [Alphaproteobacteria bacterium SS10]
MADPQQLVVFVDGSVYSPSVCDHAAWIAERTGDTVELVHVIDRRKLASPPSDLSGTIALGARTALLEELADLDERRSRLAQVHGRAILDDAKALLEKAGIENVTTKLRIEDVVEAVTEIEENADMLVIGKRGEAADFATLHLGSNLERIARHSDRPVFVASRAFKPINRVLLAYDGGRSAMKAADHMARSRLFEGLECHVLIIGSDNAENQQRLADAKALLEAGGHKTTGEIMPGVAEKTIGRVVEEQEFDMVVMGAYGHSRIRNMLIGSTTSEMIRSCLVPIMLFR